MPPDPAQPDPFARHRRHRRRARLDRQFASLRRTLPWLDGWIAHLQSDRAARIRLPIALVLVLGGMLWFLPILGLWMLPAGLFLLAIDVPALQAPVSAWSIRARRWWARRRRKRQGDARR